MKVAAVHNIIGWVYDKLRIETRKTYSYPDGSVVTVIDRRNITVSLYNKQGLMDGMNLKGSKIDKSS